MHIKQIPLSQTYAKKQQKIEQIEKVVTFLSASVAAADTFSIR